MTKVEVFDPPMCCSTGICGPSVDPQLVTFAADLEAASMENVEVRRYNLSQEPSQFATRSEVVRALTEGGNDVLPLIIIDGSVKSSGRYPSRDEIMSWIGKNTGSLDYVSRGMVELGVAVGSGCETTLAESIGKLIQHGVDKGTIKEALAVATKSREGIGNHITEVSERLLGNDGLSALTSQKDLVNLIGSDNGGSCCEDGSCGPINGVETPVEVAPPDSCCEGGSCGPTEVGDAQSAVAALSSTTTGSCCG